MQRQVVVRTRSDAMVTFAASPVAIDVDHHAVQVRQMVE
jgi:hypothetical protein